MSNLGAARKPILDRFMKNVAVTFSVAKSISEWLLI